MCDHAAMLQPPLPQPTRRVVRPDLMEVRGVLVAPAPGCDPLTAEGSSDAVLVRVHPLFALDRSDAAEVWPGGVVPLALAHGEGNALGGAAWVVHGSVQVTGDWASGPWADAHGRPWDRVGVDGLRAHLSDGAHLPLNWGWSELGRSTLWADLPAGPWAALWRTAVRAGELGPMTDPYSENTVVHQAVRGLATAAQRAGSESADLVQAQMKAFGLLLGVLIAEGAPWTARDADRWNDLARPPMGGIDDTQGIVWRAAHERALLKAAAEESGARDPSRPGVVGGGGRKL